MSGIYGFTGKNDCSLLENMGKMLSNRGVDGKAEALFADLSMGQVNLSAMDPVENQKPIPNEDESLWLAFDGEIYNHMELKEELLDLGHNFSCGTHWEVVMHAFEEYGTGCFDRLNGSWGLALFDKNCGKLLLSRDHFGVRPLYYVEKGGRFLFSSKIKPLLTAPFFKASPNDQMVYEYLTLGLHEHKKETFFKDIFRVMPGSFMEVDVKKPAILKSYAYWTPRLEETQDGDPKEFYRLFKQAVKRRMQSKHPEGASLSGGLDSTSIACLMRDVMEEKEDFGLDKNGLKTFSAVFDNDPIDEREYINVAQDAIKADATFVRPQAKAFAQDVMDLVWCQEEPFVSTGPYAQWCVMKEAAKKVGVLLDGQGGDELLGGYVPYHFIYLKQLLKMRKPFTALKEAWDAKDILLPFLKRRLEQRKKRFSIKGALKEGFIQNCREGQYGRSSDNLKKRLLQDLTTYSLPALLRYEDKNSAAFSLQSRVPYLDQDLVRWILKLPSSAFIKNGWSRAILRDGLLGVIPDKIRLRRWKVGFTTPEMRWLKTLRATFTALFLSPSFCARPYWKGECVAESFRDACEGKIEGSMFFWRCANVELWLRTFIDVQPITGPGPGIAPFADLYVRKFLVTEKHPEIRVQKAVPNFGKQIFVTYQNKVYARIPVKTKVIVAGDDINKVAAEALKDRILPKDMVAVAEKPVSITQGRSFPLDQIQPSPLARLLSRSVTKTPHGIGIGTPQTMQLALNEAGIMRILFAAAVAALARLVGMRGIFYKIAGEAVEAIDGPTLGTLPPYNKEASLGPKNPNLVAREIKSALFALSEKEIEVFIVDANDISAKILGATNLAKKDMVKSLLLDNPMGQGHEQTPLVILREIGELNAQL